MELKDITNRPLRVRVLGNSQENAEFGSACLSLFSSSFEIEKLIGQELEVKSKDYECKTIKVWNKEKNKLYNLHFSQVAELTPITHNNRYIAIGDQVKYLDRWHTVYGYHYHWGHKDWIVDVIGRNDFEEGRNRFLIEDHRLQEENEVQNRPKIIASDENLIAELERRGLVQEGKVIK